MSTTDGYPFPITKRDESDRIGYIAPIRKPPPTPIPPIDRHPREPRTPVTEKGTDQ